MGVCGIDRVGVCLIWRSAVSNCCAVLPHFHGIGSSLTLRSIHDRLEHQRNECNEEKVIDEELGRTPERSGCALGDSIGAGIFRGGRSRVSGSVARGGGGGGKASVEGVERVDASEPGKKGKHFKAGAWRNATIKVKGRGIEGSYAEGVYLRVSGGSEAVPTGHGVILWGANHRPRISQQCITILINLSVF